MFADELRDIVHHSSDGGKTTPILALVNIVVPFNDWKLIKRDAPVKFGSLLVKFLLKLLETTLFDFILSELLEVESQAKLLPCPDSPFGRIVLEPFNGIAVIGWEFVVEVVITFSQGDKSSDQMITGRVAIIEGLVPKPMCERVDTEGSLLNEEDAEDASIYVSAHPVTPTNAGNERGENKAHEEDDLEIVLVLPNNDWILVQITDIGTANTLGVLLHDHPSKVRIEKTLANGVGIFVGIGVSVVSPVVSCPPSNGSFDGTSAHSCKEDSQWPCGGI